MSATHSVADSSLGFTQSELVFLRQQQQVLAQRSHSGTVPDRGRGHSRTSQHSSSSRAASAASSHSVPGRVLLDPNTLDNLAVHLENILASIRNRINELTTACERSVERSRNQASRSMQETQAEIERFRMLMTQLDRLEDDNKKIKSIRDKIKVLKRNTDAVSDRLDRSRPSGHGSATRPRR